ncbi:MAG: [FeFe] hydrogenase H-cluster radical SAM maturase HydE [Rikenellaceae bacterium]
MLNKINRLRDSHTLSECDYREIITCRDPEVAEYLALQAREVSQSVFGNEVFVRGLIEITNICKNGCYYCGIRSANRDLRRYRLSREEIVKCCVVGYSLDFRTFVLQGGEDPSMTIDWLVEVVQEIRSRFADAAITLSLGEMRFEDYERLKEAGANRYLLRHESYNRELYERLHPTAMSHDNRLECLESLKEIGFQTGTGFMVGAPTQSIENIVEDIKYIERLSPEMVGVGPFISHHNTPFGSERNGDIELTLKLISIFRLMNPHALIPSTTSLATLCKDGHKRGILAGANVIMPNLSPVELRAQYSLYDNKASFGAEAAEGLEILGRQLGEIGYKISYQRGDYK